MIPKIIHYCWLSGDPYPESIQRCIDSWKRMLPDYELVLWDTKRFNLSFSTWVKQAFESKKYAFAADYIRMYALYHYGGIYLDSDVEVIKSFDDLLHLPYFIGQENTPSGIEAATIGSEKGWPLAKLMLDRYDSKCFRGEEGHMDLRSLPYLLRRCIEFNYTYNPIDSISQFNPDETVVNVFPVDYFSPKEWTNGRITVTDRTYSIHHFAASWMSSVTEKKSKRILLKERIALLYRKACSLNCRDVVLLSNRSLAIHYYNFFFQDHTTPLLNTRLYGDDFVRLLDLMATRDPSTLALRFIPQHQSIHTEAGFDFYPVGIIEGTDIEIHFIHSLTTDEAKRDWETGLSNMNGKKWVVAYVILSKEEENLYARITLPKFSITPADPGLCNLNQNNCDSYFWRRFPVMRGMRKKVKKSLTSNGIPTNIHNPSCL